MLVTAKIALSVMILFGGVNLLIEKFISDDAYYYFVIAKNVLTKGCVCFNEGIQTNGFHPLYMLLIAPFFAMSDPDMPIIASMALLSAVDVLTGIVIYWILKFLKYERAGLVAMFLWYFNPRVVFTTMTGVETPLKTLLLAVLTLYFVKKGTSMRPWVVALLLLALSLARLDAIVLIIWIMVLLVIKFKWTPLKVAATVAPAGTFYIAFATISKALVGYWLPISGVAVRELALRVMSPLDATVSKLAFVAKRTLLFNSFGFGDVGYVLMIAALVVVPVALMLKRIDVIRRTAPIWTLLIPWLILEVMYYAVIQKTYREWYAHPVYMLCAIVFGLLFYNVLSNRRLAIPFTIVLGASLLISWSNMWAEGNYIGSQILKQRGGMAIEIGYDNVGSFNTGIPQYYSPNKDVINLDGVVNPEAVSYMLNDRMDEYIRIKGIKYIADELSYIKTFGLVPDNCTLKPVEIFNITYYSHTQPNHEEQKDYGIYEVNC